MSKGIGLIGGGSTTQWGKLLFVIGSRDGVMARGRDVGYYGNVDMSVMIKS